MGRRIDKLNFLELAANPSGPEHLSTAHGFDREENDEDTNLLSLRCVPRVQGIQTQPVAAAGAGAAAEYVHGAHSHAELPPHALRQLPVREPAPFRLPRLFFWKRGRGL